MEQLYYITYKLHRTQEEKDFFFNAETNSEAAEIAREELHRIWLRQGGFTVLYFNLCYIAEDGEIKTLTDLSVYVEHLYVDDSQSNWYNDALDEAQDRIEERRAIEGPVENGSHPTEWYLTHSIEEWTDFPF